MLDVVILVLMAILFCLLVYQVYELLRENRRRASEEVLVGLEHTLFRLKLTEHPFLNREGMYG